MHDVNGTRPTTMRSVSLAMGGETFVFRFTLATARDMLDHLGRLASDPTVTLTWYDVAKLSDDIRRMMGKPDSETPIP